MPTLTVNSTSSATYTTNLVTSTTSISGSPAFFRTIYSRNTFTGTNSRTGVIWKFQIPSFTFLSINSVTFQASVSSATIDNAGTRLGGLVATSNSSSSITTTDTSTAFNTTGTPGVNDFVSVGPYTISLSFPAITPLSWYVVRGNMIRSTYGTKNTYNGSVITSASSLVIDYNAVPVANSLNTNNLFFFTS